MISPKKMKAIACLLDSESVTEAASKSGVSRSTLHRWLADDPVFQSEYQAARFQVFQQAIVKLQKASTTAAQVLLEIAVGDGPSNSRVSAARCILDFSRASIETENLASDVRSLMKDYSQRRQEIKK